VLEATAGEPEADVNLLDLAQLGYSESGDRELIESILGFSRMLLQNCGNRSLYASSSHLNSLLNTTSLSLLESTLVLGIELAQRYQAAVKRMNVNSKHQAGMLQNHYNINLDKVNQLAMPFSKKVVAHQEQVGPTTPVTPSGKGKEKAYFNSPAGQRGSTTTVYATDLVSMIKGGSGTGGSPTGARNGVAAASQPEVMWDDWGDIKLTYYPKSTSEPEPTVTPGPPRNATSSPAAPVTPTPIRRASNLGPHGHRPSRVSSSDDAPRIPIAGEDVQRLSFKTIEISSTKLKSSGVHSLIQQNVTDLAPEFQYELLTKLRVADALTSSLEARQQLLVVRLLAITNLAYIHQEPTFIETVLKQDSDEPRRLQLAYQLAELVHPPAEGDVAVPRPIQTVAFCALDALSQHQTKYSDVCAALNTNVNHGVLLYVIRKAVAGMSVHETGDKTTEEDEWRDALFSLISDLSVMPRTGGDLVTAGLIPILVEILNLRTPVAERYQPKVLSFLDTIMYSARDAFQTLVNADGLDAVSNLIVFQVTTTSEKVESGKGMQSDHRSATVDYEVPYFQQQALKWLFKFIHHMMSSAGAYGNNFDRLLRNLIDSSPLLGSLREIISNAHRFGSIVWTNAVSILNDFINNEPTSFAVIAEAGLSKGLLEAVTCKPIDMPAKSKKSEPEVPELDTADETEAPSSPHSDEEDSDDEYGQAPDRPTLAELQTPREGPLARGIMPTAETISIVPQAFGAICLNNAGMKMFQASGALESFFEVFESPEHVKCMDSNRELPTNLGSTFDELVRHHPPLKTAIMNAILNMVTRVSSLCNTKAANNKTGTKLWTLDAAGNVVIADKDMKSSHVQPSAKGKGTAVDESADVEMVDADVPTENGTSSSPPDFSSGTMTPFIAAVASFLSTICANSAIRSEFSAKGGIEFVLDLADSPCITPDFADGTASRSLQNVIALLAEQKPHLTMPSLLRRAQVAADVLLPFATHQGSDPFFKAFVNREAQQSESVDFLARGSEFAKAMVTIHSLIPTLHSCFQTSAYSHRNSNLSFNQLNLGDYYVRLVKSLGPLLGASFREELYLDKVLPDSYKDVPRPSRSFFASSSSPSFDDYSSLRVFPPVAEQEQPATQSSEQLNGDSNTATPAKPPLTGSFNSKSKALTEAEMQTPEFKNFQILRHLLSKVSRTISPFFQTLGKSLVNKRGTADGFQKQSHGEIATALAEILLAELNPEKGYYSFEGASHWMGIVDVLKDVLVDGMHITIPPPPLISSC
jgi:E3 ubiquitin-protein ligase HUWE1